ncbi:myo-inositol 2-dehydrogenase/D-chiro-inositol 1-dehydrogenase [Rhizobium leguminosarum]|uniref:Myo-inositol 2-dehydrogenase/D-chiro-inositol 1-dehydrogenase n=1 Tax=Rhizobium leguminosarum TaxID=384 RepID=A0AAE2MLN2_RHILE|nr:MULTISPECIES: inositol 2-dehydrogenase [Rhizobium]MBB4291474.1 myo-inositol 2-dehydrogenase/D-chiro-inositol 1-dehydrogenase [Rhizobium leguminosarum]MBB4296171.1 myo-inositol 2-dehydrogenase/D-chiro-inositol 1-dehydrogenase [Rhizobium leguminosarum]MBB4308570.1 myo-inositol 2-dehydrogenase/D-chiro-inositol 1-dehydrogenase [Rhizobium leguminosarum]MBB4416405.1 myo-inositol 2-dehydrogenase/D-chiro-inositol 1-dehydrogenase [Rhizobium leguminosarum]MBB4430628.1 myo-inositol 2-dehydrogenase/D-c
MLKVAVLGAGRIGQIHAANVAASAQAELVVVADPVEATASSTAQKLNCEFSVDPYAVIGRSDVDAVVIGTPTDTHVPLTLVALKAGKAVLCEKPLDLDQDKANAAIVEIEKSGRPFMLAFNRRFDPSASEIKRAIEAGEIGDVRQVIITSRDPSPPPADYIRRSGGIFKDMLIHDFDMARWLLGEEPVEVFAMGNCLVDRDIAQLNDYDTTMVIMRTASGKQCHINTCRHASYGHDQRIEVFGSKGMLQNGHVRPHTVHRFNDSSTDAQAPLLNFFLERYKQAYELELDAFIEAVETGSKMPVGADDGRKALALAEAALKSLEKRAGVLVD